MSTYLVKKSFKGAINGIYVREFATGDRAVIDDADLARVALAEGWIESHEAGEKSVADAPKNKAAKAAPKNKATE